MKRFYRTVAGLALAAALAVTTIGGSFPASETQAAGSGRIQAQFFVSPDGNDKNEGTYDKPFATLKAARDAVRKINGSMSGDIYVFVEQGSYYMEETLTLNESDSGTNGYKVIYRNLDKTGSAELIGGRKVETKWELVDASGDPAANPDADLPASAQGKVYKTHVGEDLSFYTLYVNDRRATLARTQNRANSYGFQSALTPYMRSAGGGVGDLIYKAGDLNQDAIDGLVNAQRTLPFGTPEEVYREVTERLELFSKGGGFVFNTIHNIQANVPVENLLAMFEALEDFRKKQE